jgi:hypothetical protein
MCYSIWLAACQQGVVGLFKVGRKLGWRKCVMDEYNRYSIAGNLYKCNLCGRKYQKAYEAQKCFNYDYIFTGFRLHQLSHEHNFKRNK